MTLSDRSYFRIRRNDGLYLQRGNGMLSPFGSIEGATKLPDDLITRALWLLGRWEQEDPERTEGFTYEPEMVK